MKSDKMRGEREREGEVVREEIRGMVKERRD